VGGLFSDFDAPRRLLQGAEAVRNWFKKRQKQALFARKHRVVATMQDFMEQCGEVRPSIAHQGYFEAGVERSGAVWFQVVWDKFWDEMLPGLRDAWAEKRVDKHRVTAMPFSRSEVQKVLEDYKDAEGKVYMKDQVCMFKRCRCVDADGNKKVCVPPKPGWMCKRRADLFKCRVILQREKRMMDERKREEAAIQQAVENARVAATAFCHSEEGIQRFRKRAVKRAAIEMDERRRIEFNENYDNKLKAKLARIEKRFDDKDRKLRARRGKAEAELYKKLKDDLEPKESTTEGYAQETIKRQIKEVLTTLKNMPEDRDIRYNERARQRAIKAAQKNRDSKEWHKAVGIMKLFEPASTNLLAEAELAQELSHDLHTRYIDKQLKKAEAEVRKEHAAMRKISGAWSGMGALEVFRGWRKWARREAKRRAKDVFCAQRDELKWAADCVAALELAQWTVDKYDKFVDEWSDEPYWVHRETQVTVWDEPNVEALLPPGMAEKFPERLVIEDERTWLRIKDEQAEAKRMELKEGLEEYSDSEDETRTMVTEGLSDDEEEGWSSAESSEEDEQTVATQLSDDESTKFTKGTSITVHTRETDDLSDEEEKKVEESSSDSDDSDDLRWEQDATRFIKAEDALAIVAERDDEEERQKRRDDAHAEALERCRMRRRIVFNPKTYIPPVPVKHYQAMARGEMRENKVFGTNFEEGEVLPETEEDVFQMIGFDPQKEYNPGEMTKMAREADKLCRKFKIGDYDPRRQREEESESDDD
jgi:hypothetical protein